ncbi:MAG: glycoside hydrolase family 97 N-terminal domain-containing protein, partial [Ignavibacteria bacterium]|nr:glycoside hydrolase family 97 N-terminal domain-containing protein [Ignavibacteria bacterium]
MINSKNTFDVKSIQIKIDKAWLVVVVLLMSSSILIAQKNNEFEIKSPDSTISLYVTAGTKLQWSFQHKAKRIITPSAISLQLEDGEALGDNAEIISSNTIKIDNIITPLNYKKAKITDKCNQLTINFKDDYGVIFRVYNDAVAYRFFTNRNGEVIIKNEEANFNFTDDHKAFIPYMWDYRGNKIFNNSFEALYRETTISQFAKDSLAFLPLLVDVGSNKKVVILEADLEDYPGMFLNVNETQKGFMGVFAAYPLETMLGGYE